MTTLPSLQNPFLSVPQKKIDDALQDIKQAHSQPDGTLTVDGGILVQAIHRYVTANIPVDYS
jgi:hypothetical protein